MGPAEGIAIMRMQSRLLRLALLVPGSLLLGTGAQAEAPDSHAHMDMPAKAAPSAAHWSRWSDPASWPDGKVPGAGDAVTIARDKAIVLDVTPPALRSLTIDGKLSFADKRDLEPDDRLDLPARRRARHRQRGQALHAQGDDHADRQRPGRRHQHDGRPRHHDAERHAQPARRPRQQHLDQARAARPRPAARRIDVLNAAGWRKGDDDRARLDRLTIRARPRSAPSPPSAAIRSRSIKPLAVHALRRDHLRRRRARRGRPADPQHQDPGLGRRREDLLRRPHHGDGRLEDVHLGRRAQPHGPEHAPGPLSDALAHRRRRAGAVHRELLDPRHLQPLRDRPRHQRRAGRRTTSPTTPSATASSSKTASSTATSSSTTSPSRPSAIRPCPACRPTSPPTERETPTYKDRAANRRRPASTAGTS